MNTTTKTETTSYGKRSDAARALRRIGPNLEDLLEQNDDGRWTFDPEDARKLAAIEGDEKVGDDAGSPASNPEPEHKEPEMESKTNFSLEDALAEEAALNAADKAAGKPAPKAGETDEQRAAKAEEKRLKSEAKAAEKKAAAEAKAKAQAEKAAEKEAEAEKAKAEKAERAAAKLAEKNKGREEREAKAKAKQDAADARAKKKSDEKQAKIDAEQKRKDEREAARIARANSVKNGIRLPGPNSKLGKLWALIEGLKAANDGAFPTFQEYKAAASTMSYEDAGNQATITTGYYDYRMYHGVTGRIVAPKPDAAADAPADPANAETPKSEPGEGAQAE